MPHDTNAVGRGKALVVGASGGLGHAFCDALTNAGTYVVAAGRDKFALTHLVAQGRAKAWISCDLLEPDCVEKLVAETGQINLLVITAGIAHSMPLIDRSWNDIYDELAVNALSVLRLMHSFGQLMIKNGGGEIILIGSTAASRPAPHLAPYAASKAFLLSIAKSLSREWAPLGVRVTCCLTGPINTPFAVRAGLAEPKRRRDPARVASKVLAASKRDHSGVIFSDLEARLRAWLFEIVPASLLCRFLRN